MKNPCLDIALRELESAGIRGVEHANGGKHIQVRWRVNDGELRMYSLPATPSDWRATHNTKAGIRRILREDGVISPPPRQPDPPRKPDRLGELERRVATLEATVAAMKIDKEGNAT